MIKQLTIILVIAFMTMAGSGNYDTNAKIKAIYIYNFTNYIEWPDEYRKTAFVIGVLGDTPLYNELEKISLTKKVFEQPIEVRKFNSANELNKCHILFISSGNKDPFSTVVSKIKMYSTLIVTDTPGMATKGSAINFVIRANRQKFELNESNAVKYNLKVSNSLEALAILVN